MSPAFPARAARCLVLVLALACVGGLAAQAGNPAASANPAGAATVDPKAPRPYAADEFPDWLKTVRRFEVVAIGSFPLAFLYTSLAYDIGRYVDMNVRGDPNAPLYAPFIFAPSDKPAFTTEEATNLIIATIGVSLAVAAGDLVIGLVQDAEAQAKAKALAAQAQADQEKRAREREAALDAPASGDDAGAAGPGAEGPAADAAPVQPESSGPSAPEAAP